ncbi:AbiH family protein [Sphingobacterium siyangense]|uniref:AbiH family protein n=1 Tax=Sphingobacterium siyangense TaxID=459529 RepID=UPI003DA58D85
MLLTKRRNKIFLIGNGFDLAHGLPTRYIDFIKWYLKECCINAIETGDYVDECLIINIQKGVFFDRGIDIRKHVEELFASDKIWEFLVEPYDLQVTSSYTSIQKNGDFMIKITPLGEFCKNLFFNCKNSDWNGVEYEINRIMLKEHSNLKEIRTEILIDRNKNRKYQEALKRIKQLNLSVFKLKSKLIEYLKLHNNPAVNKVGLITHHYNNNWGKTHTYKDMDIYVQGLKASNPNGVDVSRRVLFLNFNYTTYFDQKIVKEFDDQLEDQFTNTQTIYIHGDLDTPTDQIVFGVGDENKEIYSEIESLYDDDWLEPLKSFHYFRNDKYQQLLGFIASGEYEVYVIGHSCGITDRTLLNMLFENESCKEIHVYHYSGINSYLTTAYNIARNFNDKVKLRSVLQPFNPKLTTQ